MRPGDSLFLSDLPTPRQEQFRLRRLQVHNWGTFSGLHDIPIAERGFLFVGRSGSGKSTLLDALAALLVPPMWVDFNAAAREAARSGRDRSLASYVRGAWADRSDEESGEVATQYLRRGATWSALVAEYRNDLGRCVSLVRVFWLAGNSSAAADVRKHYMIAEREFDLGRELDGFDLDLRRLKHRLTDVHHHDSFNAYSERFRQLLGIEHEAALRLLHKTQSAKNLGDLNAFLRDFMLERPKTFQVADRLVAEFAELDAAHQAVVTARKQIETLQPARTAFEQRQTMLEQASGLEALIQGIDGFREKCRLRLLDEALNKLETEDQGLAGREQTRRDAVSTLDRELQQLHDQYRAQGGGRIQELEREREELKRERDDRMRRREEAERGCRQLGWTLAQGPEAFAEQTAEARTLLDAGRQRREERDDQLKTLGVQENDLGQELRRLKAEVDALERSPSNISAPMQALRRRLADAVGMDEGAFPFAAELMQVRPDEAQWQGAIERLLHGFARSLLVDERHYSQVARWVNETHLHGKLVYFRVPRLDMPARAPTPGSVAGKLEIKDHPHAAWLRDELQRRFDYQCVASVEQLRQRERAVTEQGQIRHGGGRHEKDDRTAINDRKHWVLGFDNRDKLALFRSEAREVGARLADIQTQVRALHEQRENDFAQSRAAQSLANLAWRDIDVATLLQRIDAIDAQIEALRRGSATLQELGAKIDELGARLDHAKTALADTVADRKQLDRRRDELAHAHQQCRERLQGPHISESQEAGLKARLQTLSTLTLANIEGHFRRIERDLAEQLKQFEAQAAERAHQVTTAFAAFMRLWPEDSGDLQADLEASDDFFARLRRLEQDGLPAHESRFFDLLRSQSHQNLLALQTHISHAHKSIRSRMEDVNASLEQVSFNPDSILQIRVEDLRLADVVEFRKLLAQVLSHQQTEDRALAEEQFGIMRGLVARLTSQDGEDRRWRDQVLDVRRHVEFIGEELEAGSRRQLEVYRSGAGKSGGQRQKLATTCLAAALRYQLGGADGGLPQYAAIVLDEAFDKADNEFTAMAMSIFENFGFQMVVATPLKSVMTLEPFIGGACFVEINGRHDSGVLMIEYNEQSRRLALPERNRADADVANT